MAIVLCSCPEGSAGQFRAGHTNSIQVEPQNKTIMKTQNKYLFASLILCLLMLSGCSSDGTDDEIAIVTEPDPEYTVDDLSATIEENPEDGAVLGTLSTDLPGTLSFTTDNPAFGFDPTSLEVTVADRTAFDYELNTSVTGTLTITNGQDSVESIISITLTDFIDAIEGLLSTSKDAYVSASNGDWIEVTKDEFETLESQLQEVTHSGTTPADYDFINTSTGISMGTGDSAGFTLANVSDATLPVGSYLFGIRFFVGTGIFGVCENNKVKLSETNASEGYVDIGNPFPEKTSIEREVFFVLKGNFSATTNIAHLALYFGPANGATRKDSSGFSHLQSGDITDFVNVPTEGSTYAYQGLSTTKLQWE